MHGARAFQTIFNPALITAFQSALHAPVADSVAENRCAPKAADAFCSQGPAAATERIALSGQGAFDQVPHRAKQRMEVVSAEIAADGGMRASIPPKVEAGAIGDIGVESFLHDARAAAYCGNHGTAAEAYRVALERFEAVDASGQALYLRMPGGRGAMLEALGGNVAFRDVTPVAVRRVLGRHLQQFIDRGIDEKASPEARLQGIAARTFNAALQMRVSASHAEPIDQLFQHATAELQKAKQLLEIEEPSERVQDLAVGARLLDLEVLSMRLIHAHNRGDSAERKHLRGCIHRAVNELHTLLESERQGPAGYDFYVKVERVGHQIIDVAELLMRLRLKKPAINLVRDILDRGLFRGTSARKRLVEHPEFRPYVRLGERIPEGSELRDYCADFTGKSPLEEGAKAALKFAHANGLAQTVGVAAAGAVAAAGLQYCFSGEASAFGATFGVLLSTVAYRFITGARSEEARSAYYTADSSVDVATETPWHAWDLLRKAGYVALFSAIPISIIGTGRRGLEMIAHTLANAKVEYVDKIGQGIVRGVASLFSPETYSSSGSMVDAVNSAVVNASAADLALGAMRAYEASAVAMYAYFMFGPVLLRALDVNGKGQQQAERATAWAEKHAWMFMPGALLLFADLGTVLAGKGVYWQEFAKRLFRGVIVSFNMYVGLLVTGIVASRQSQGEVTVGSTVRNFFHSMKKQKHFYPMAGLISQIFNAVVGGHIQGPNDITFLRLASEGMHGNLGEAQDLASLALLQGCMVTLALYPLCVLTSGLPKGVIPVRERWSEARRDGIKAGVKLWRRWYEQGRAVATSFFKAGYPENRFKRIFSIDLIPAFVRALLGWDSTAGHTTFALMNSAAFEPAATAIWPETTGTAWQRNSDALKSTTEEIAARVLKQHQDEGDPISAEEAHQKAAKIFDTFFRKSGQLMSIAHPFLDFKEGKDQAYPAKVLLRSDQLPKFPHRPDVRSFDNVYHMIMGDRPEHPMRREILQQFFSAIEEHASDPELFHVTRWWAITLAKARNSEAFGGEIQDFFAQHPEVVHGLALDLDQYQPMTSSWGRLRREDLHRTLADAMPFERYEQRVHSYRRQSYAVAGGGGNALFGGREDLTGEVTWNPDGPPDSGKGRCPERDAPPPSSPAKGRSKASAEKKKGAADRKRPPRGKI